MQANLIFLRKLEVTVSAHVFQMFMEVLHLDWIAT